MKDVKKLLDDVASGVMSVEQGVKLLTNRQSAALDLGHTVLDVQRSQRNGFPEIIYGEGKSAEQLVEIFSAMKEHSNVIASRVPSQYAESVQQLYPEACYYQDARMLTWSGFPKPRIEGTVGILSAGTSDLPIAKEAQVTCEMLGCQTCLFQDIGIAGLHRLLNRLSDIQQMQVLIVIAGMEGALASVVGGLVSQPVIAVPSSVGYGAGFSGLSALLAMLTSCSAGISVVNIDNGVGAACAAFRSCMVAASRE